MNAKELRQAAEAVKMDAEISLKEELGSLPASYKTIGAFTVKLMDHILATVREDDGEPVTEERFRAFSNSTFCGFPAVLHTLGHRGIAWLDHGPAVTFGDNEFDVLPIHLVTMGQFRSLCRGLGIELNEVARV